MPKTVEQKREEADQRQSIRDARTVEDQLDLLDTRPGGCERERLRLTRLMNEQNTQPAKRRKKSG